MLSKLVAFLTLAVLRWASRPGRGAAGRLSHLFHIQCAGDAARDHAAGRQVYVPAGRSRLEPQSHQRAERRRQDGRWRCSTRSRIRRRGRQRTPRFDSWRLAAKCRRQSRRGGIPAKSIGYEFIYPRQQALQLAKVDIRASPDDGEGDDGPRRRRISRASTDQANQPP